MNAVLLCAVVVFQVIDTDQPPEHVTKYLQRCVQERAAAIHVKEGEIQAISRRNSQTADTQKVLHQARAELQRLQDQPPALAPLGLPPNKDDMGVFVSDRRLSRSVDVLEVIDDDEAIIRAWYVPQLSPSGLAPDEDATFVDLWVRGIKTGGLIARTPAKFSHVFHVTGNATFDTTCGKRSLPLLEPFNIEIYKEALGVLAGSSTANDRILERYVHEPDPAYAWKVVNTIEGDGAKTLVVQLTSQSWRTNKDVDRTKWEHWLVVVVPEKPVSKTAFVLVGGGSNGGGPPDKPDAITAQIARATGSVVAELKQVPNQPLTFHGDGVPRKEDDLIGYAWDQYLKTSDATWLPRLPMVKSVVRAMDCIQEMLQMEKFVIAGGSKRGWTTWMTGAADRRVEAIVPIVIDVVNVDPSMRHHAAVYGFWANAIGDYYNHRITERWGTPEFGKLLEVVDPYFHRDRLTMPKYIVNAAGDQFFCPDSSQFYFDDLKGEKLLRYVPNTDHSLRSSDAVESIAVFHQMILASKPRPKYAWTFEKDGSIRVTTQDRPAHVLLWQANNPKSRDFRLMTIGPAYTSRELTATGDGVFTGRVDPPAAGWTAFFVELTFETGTKLPLKVTTAVRVLPDKLPHADTDIKAIPYEPNAKKGQ